MCVFLLCSCVSPVFVFAVRVIRVVFSVIYSFAFMFFVCPPILFLAVFLPLFLCVPFNVDLFVPSLSLSLCVWGGGGGGVNTN